MSLPFRTIQTEPERWRENIDETITRIGSLYQGATGSTGATGNSFTGLRGSQGMPGSGSIKTGPTGFIGIGGIQGNDGVGFQGITGLVGFTGANGSLGAQGQQGIQGARGLTGFQGINGGTGTVGNRGFQGPQGSSLPGQTGFQGIQGENGPQGSQGIETTGPQGPNSTSTIFKSLIYDPFEGIVVPSNGDFVNLNGASFSLIGGPTSRYYCVRLSVQLRADDPNLNFFILRLIEDGNIIPNLPVAYVSSVLDSFSSDSQYCPISQEVFWNIELVSDGIPITHDYNVQISLIGNPIDVTVINFGFDLQVLSSASNIY